MTPAARHETGPPAGALPPWARWAALAVVAAALLARSLTTGPTADDLTALDAATRSGPRALVAVAPATWSVLGAWIVRALISLVGGQPAALHVANALLFAGAVALFAALAARLAGARVAAIAAAMLVLFPPTGGLAAWLLAAPGIVALAAVLAALAARAWDRSPWLAAAACVVAPLAAGPGFVAPLLVVALDVALAPRDPWRGRLPRVAPAFLGLAAAVAIDLAIRGGGVPFGLATEASAWVSGVATWATSMWPAGTLDGLRLGLRHEPWPALLAAVAALALVLPAPVATARAGTRRGVAIVAAVIALLGALAAGAAHDVGRPDLPLVAAAGSSLFAGVALAAAPAWGARAALALLALVHWGANGVVVPGPDGLPAPSARAFHAVYREEGAFGAAMLGSIRAACEGLRAQPTFVAGLPDDPLVRAAAGPGARLACRDTSLRLAGLETLDPVTAAGSFALLRFDPEATRFVLERVRAPARARIGEGFLLRARPEVAVACFRAALAERPGERELAYPYALALAASGAADSARAFWSRARARGEVPDPDTVLARLAWGVTPADVPALRAALAPALAAAWRDPADAGAHRALGLVLLERRSARQAVLELLAAAGLSRSAEDLAWLGRALETSGERDAARISYLEALQSGLPDATYQMARAGLARLGAPSAR